jgi:hypothetical protein
MMPAEMQQNVDYFYCEVCKIHVPCVRLEPGIWEVQCPNCVGECALCGCHLANHCFGQGSGPAQMRLRVVKSKPGS